MSVVGSPCPISSEPRVGLVELNMSRIRDLALAARSIKGLHTGKAAFKSCISWSLGLY